MITIEMTSGNTIEVNYVLNLDKSREKIAVNVDDARSIAQIALDFDGTVSFKVKDSKNPKITEIYDDYETRSVSRLDTGSVRIVLEKT